MMSRLKQFVGSNEIAILTIIATLSATVVIVLTVVVVNR